MYIVSYDISSDRLRAKIAKTLEGYGVRVQYSVFECDLTEKKFKDLYAELLRLATDLSDGSIRFYYLCGRCSGKVKTIGQISPEREQLQDDIIIV